MLFFSNSLFYSNKIRNILKSINHCIKMNEWYERFQLFAWLFFNVVNVFTIYNCIFPLKKIRCLREIASFLTYLMYVWLFRATDEKTISVKVPDTITTWHASGYAISPVDGIGIATQTSIRAFQPFFVSLSLPYSVKRGEVLNIPATVFNYMDKCLVVSLVYQLYFHFSYVQFE